MATQKKHMHASDIQKLCFGRIFQNTANHANALVPCVAASNAALQSHLHLCVSVQFIVATRDALLFECDCEMRLSAVSCSKVYAIASVLGTATAFALTQTPRNCEIESVDARAHHVFRYCIVFARFLLPSLYVQQIFGYHIMSCHDMQVERRLVRWGVCVGKCAYCHS